jgi:hypothetical protein
VNQVADSSSKLLQGFFHELAPSLPLMVERCFQVVVTAVILKGLSKFPYVAQVGKLCRMCAADSFKAAIRYATFFRAYSSCVLPRSLTAVVTRPVMSIFWNLRRRRAYTGSCSPEKFTISMDLTSASCVFKSPYIVSNRALVVSVSASLSWVLSSSSSWRYFFVSLISQSLRVSVSKDVCHPSCVSSIFTIISSQRPCVRSAADARTPYTLFFKVSSISDRIEFFAASIFFGCLTLWPSFLPGQLSFRFDQF